MKIVLTILLGVIPWTLCAGGPSRTLPRDYRPLCGDWVRYLSPSQIEMLINDYDAAFLRFIPKYSGDPAGLRNFARRYKNFVVNRENILKHPDSKEARKQAADFLANAGKGARILRDYTAGAVFYALSAFFYEALGADFASDSRNAYEMAAFCFKNAGDYHNDDELLAIGAIYYEWAGVRSRAHEISVHLIYPERIDQLKRGMFDPPSWYSQFNHASQNRSAPPPKEKIDSRSNTELLKVLELEDGADVDAIKRARNRLVAKYHSDFHPDASEAARKEMDKKFQDIMDAFKELRKRLVF